MEVHSDWGQPPDAWELERPDVHVWLVVVDQMIPYVGRLASLLAEDERQRAERFLFERDWQQFVVARGLLRILLGSYLEYAPNRLEFSYGSHGKPSLSGAFGGGMLRFNLSHTQGRILYSVAGWREIGVDIEYVRDLPDVEQIAAGVFSMHEREALHAMPAHKKNEAFFACWARKEAFMKAIGKGLAMAPDRFEVTLAPDKPARLVDVMSDPWATSRWSLLDLPAIPGYVAALAVEGHSWNLACWHWTAEQMRRLG